MSVLAISGLRAAVAGHEILRGVDLEVRSSEVHALMGPNGSGKSTLSHTLMGRADYEVLGGSVKVDGEEILGLPTWQRAEKGLFLAMQYPVEVPGVRLVDMLEASRSHGNGEGAARTGQERARALVRRAPLALVRRAPRALVRSAPPSPSASG